MKTWKGTKKIYIDDTENANVYMSGKDEVTGHLFLGIGWG